MNGLLQSDHLTDQSVRALAALKTLRYLAIESNRLTEAGRKTIEEFNLRRYTEEAQSQK